MNHRIVPLLILLLGLMACEESQIADPPAAPVGEIGGVIYQRLYPEVPVADVELSWGGVVATSDADGVYSLDPVAAGADSLRVSHPDFVSESRWIELDDTDQQQSFTLLPLDTTSPPSPLAFSANSVEGSFLRLIWSPPADDSDLAGYWLRKSPGDPSVLRLGTESTSWLDISVAPSREYSYELSCIDASGNLSPALTTVAQVNGLPQPSRLSFPPEGDYASISLIWERNEDDDFASYRLYRDQDAVVDSTDTLVFTSTEPSDSSWTDTDVAANEVYSYRLYCEDQSGQVSTHPQDGHLRAAAQRFLGIDSSDKRLMPLPGTDRFLVSYSLQSRIHLVDGDGTLLATEEIGNSLPNLKGLPDGRVWGFRPQNIVEDAYLALIETDPLALVREGELDYAFNDLAPAGGDSLVLTPNAGGAPIVLNTLTFTSLDTLDLLSDLSARCLVVADPTGRRLFFAEPEGARRLLRVDLDAGPAISETVTLNGVITQLQMSDDGHLLIAYATDDRLARYDAADFGNLSELDVNLTLFQGRFTFGGEAYWEQDYYSGINGYDLDWPGGAATFIVHFDLIASPRQTVPLSIGGRVAIAMNNGWISLCDPGREAP